MTYTLHELDQIISVELDRLLEKGGQVDLGSLGPEQRHALCGQVILALAAYGTNVTERDVTAVMNQSDPVEAAGMRAAAYGQAATHNPYLYGPVNLSKAWRRGFNLVQRRLNREYARGVQEGRAEPGES